MPILLPVNTQEDNREYRAVYVYSQMVQTDNGAIYSIREKGSVGQIITIKIIGRNAYPVARKVKDGDGNEKPQGLANGGYTWFGNWVALAAKTIQQMQDNLYDNHAVTGSATVPGEYITGNVPTAAPDGATTLFSFNDRTATAIAGFEPLSEIVWQNGVLLDPNAGQYTPIPGSGQIQWPPAAPPNIGDILLMACQRPKASLSNHEVTLTAPPLLQPGNITDPRGW